MVFSGKTAITTFKLIQNAKVGGVLENSGYLLHHGHWDFQKQRWNGCENEPWSWQAQPPKMGRIHFSQYALLLCPSAFLWLAIKAKLVAHFTI